MHRCGSGPSRHIVAILRQARHARFPQKWQDRKTENETRETTFQAVFHLLQTSAEKPRVQIREKATALSAGRSKRIRAISRRLQRMISSVLQRTRLRQFGSLAYIDDTSGREILKQNEETHSEGKPSVRGETPRLACIPRIHSLRPEVAMSIFSYRKHLRFLSQTQRRCWWDQKKRLTPRVVIGAAYVPPNVTREFAYIKVG
jgi:hypothetical protein